MFTHITKCFDVSQLAILHTPEGRNFILHLEVNTENKDFSSNFCLLHCCHLSLKVPFLQRKRPLLGNFVKVNRTQSGFYLIILLYQQYLLLGLLSYSFPPRRQVGLSPLGKKRVCVCVMGWCCVNGREEAGNLIS